jgi:hypothetical protein
MALNPPADTNLEKNPSKIVINTENTNVKNITESPTRKRKTPINNSAIKKKKLEENEREKENEKKLEKEKEKETEKELIRNREKLSTANTGILTASLQAVTTANYNLAGIQIVFAEVFEMLSEYEINFSISLVQLTKKNAGESVNIPGGGDNYNGDTVKHEGDNNPINGSSSSSSSNSNSNHSSSSSSSSGVSMDAPSDALESKIQDPVPVLPDESVSCDDVTPHPTLTILPQSTVRPL